MEAFSEFLLSADPDFEWTPSSSPLSYISIKSQASQLAEEAMLSHTPYPDSSEWEAGK